MRVLALLVAAAILSTAAEGSPGSRQLSAKPSGTIVYSHRFWPKDDRLGDNWELFVKRLGGGPSARLTRSPRCSDVWPSWSYSGRWIAFACGYGPPAGVYAIRADGGGRRTVIRLPNWRVNGTSWSPGDRRIAFATDRGLWVVNADGTGLRRFARGEAASPTWSPNGRWIAYDHDGDVFRIGADGTGRRRLVTGADSPAWSPDGRRVVFLRRPDIWIMNAEGRGQRRLRCCRRDGVADVAWSPDSRYLAYDGGSGLDSGIHVVPIDGARGPWVAGGDELQGFSWAPSAR